MDIARAMALGGEIVYANDCDFSTYLKLGLRCPVCKEPVYLKDGEIRKPHFAHFKGTDPRQVEKCELRAAAYDNNTENISSIEDREQRLEIFQTHFLNMISIGEDKIVDDSKFNKWINLITLTHHQIINNITKGCTEYFLTHRQLIESKYIVPRTEIKDRQILLQQEIALEAMSYLCVKSSRSLLEYILHYSIYKLHNQPQEYNLLKRINTEENILGICLFTAKIIILNPWVEAFGKITAVGNKHMQEVILEQDTTEWYAVYVVKNKELTITEKIKTNIRHNILPNGASLLQKGIIDKNFYISDYIHDVAYAHTFDTSVQRITSNLHSYIFIQVEKTDVTFFNNVILPFFKMVEGVIGVCGIQIPTKYRKTEYVRQNKQDKIKRNKIYVTKPSAIAESELEQTLRTHNSFSSYQDNDTDFKVGDICYFWRLNRKKQPTVFVKVKILKFKDDINIECITVGKIEQKIVVPISNLTRSPKSVIARYK